MSRHILRKRLVCLFIAALVLSGCRCNKTTQTFDHDVIGKWKAESSAISFYDDGVGALYGEKFHWRPIDDSSVRVEIKDDILEFVMTQQDSREVIGTLVNNGKELSDATSGDPLKFRREH